MFFKEIKMSNETLNLLITFAGSAIGTIGGILASQKLTQYRIAQLEKKVDEYNNVKTRTTELETWKSLIDHELIEIKEKITKLEGLHMQSF
jgi:serine/threonine protein phosphatase PrpC